MTGARWKGEWPSLPWWKDQRPTVESTPQAEAQPQQRVRGIRCSFCGGQGFTVRDAPAAGHRRNKCSLCRGRGVVRVQLVITLVDLATGRVASRSVVPGAVPAQAGPGGRAALDLAGVVRDLANGLDASPVYRAEAREFVPWDPDLPWWLSLPYDAEAELAHEERYEYEAAAIARQAVVAPHLIFYAGVKARPRPSAEESLDRLVKLADDLQLDLVVDVRTEVDERLTWSVRLSLPGAEVREKPSLRFSSLHRALRETSAEAALDWLRRRSATAPARWLDPSAGGSAPEGVETGVTWAGLSAALTPLAVPAVGALAVRRQGEWFFSALKVAPMVGSEGAGCLEVVPSLPEPVGTLIPSSLCSKCRGEQETWCPRCAGDGRVLEGVVLTVTDLAHRTKHVNWSADVEMIAGGLGAPIQPAAERVSASGIPLRRNEMLLDRHYSVGDQAREFGVQPNLLRDHHRAAALGLWLIDGKVSFSGGDPTAAGYVRAAARNRPGGRLIVLARPEPDPPIEDLFRAVIGLGLTLIVRVRSASPALRSPATGVSSWRIQMQPASETDLTQAAGWFGSAPSLPAAVALLEAELDFGLRQALEAGKLEPVPVPHRETPVSSVDVATIESALEGLSEVFPGTDIWLGVNLTSWSVAVGRPHHRSTRAGSLNQVLAEIVAPELVTPTPDELRRLMHLLVDPAGKHQLKSETQGLARRFTFGLALAALLQVFVTERFGNEPQSEDVERYAVQLSEKHDQDDGPAGFAEMIRAVADRSGSGWHQTVSPECLPMAVQILRSLLRDRQKSDEDFTGIIDQAVEAGMLMARTVTESVERREH